MTFCNIKLSYFFLTFKIIIYFSLLATFESKFAPYSSVA